MAKIMFLPTCTNCGAILYSENIDVVTEGELLQPEVGRYQRKLITTIEPGRCPWCQEPFDQILCVQRPPYSCKTPDYYKEMGEQLI